jgi:hypothetical protein
VLELVVRFLPGGFVVSAFALLGDVVRPKSFAGLFSAAPSVALATLGLAVLTHEAGYASYEARSMVLGALPFGLYACLVSRLLLRHRLPLMPVIAGALVVWLGSAWGLWYWLVR